MKKEIIITEIQKKHPNLKIIGFFDKIHLLVENEFGICKVQYYSLLSGSLPTINTAIDKTLYFKNMLFKISPELEVLSDYKGALSKINVKTKYGICSCIANNLLKGQKPLISSAIDKTNYFIKMAEETHDYKYNYSLTNLIDYKKPVTIICPIHGEFKQTPSGHLQSKGCKKCGDTDKQGWWYKNNKNYLKKSNFYILEFTSEKETFLKFGIAVNINKRINKLKRETKFKIRIVKIIQNNAKYCYELEKRFKRFLKYKNRIYLPNLYFGGYTECFK